MKLAVLLIALASVALADTENVERHARAPQGYIKYSDPNGLKVNWRFFSPQSQLKAVLQSPQRNQRGEIGTGQPSQPPHQQYQHQAQPQPHYRQRVEPEHQPRGREQTRAHAQPQPQYQAQNQLVQSAKDLGYTQPTYSPYSSVPQHIKQLILQTYEPQRPYVDPSAFLYHSNIPGPIEFEVQPTATRYEQPASGRDHAEESRRSLARSGYVESSGRQPGGIEYREDLEQQQQQQYERHQQRDDQQQQRYHQQQQQEAQQEAQHRLSVPIETLPAQPIPKLYIDKNMPREIQQLLQYQAQIPYDVIANQILYKPKSLFVPQPLPDDAKGPYQYRSKVYYVSDGRVEPEFSAAKPVEEDQGQ